MNDSMSLVTEAVMEELVFVSTGTARVTPCRSELDQVRPG